MQPDTRCPVEGCTSTALPHINANLNGKATSVHKVGSVWIFRCTSRVDDARCLRLDEHPGPHLYASDEVHKPEPVFYEADDIEVTYEGRNKPAFQHLIDKRKDRP